MKHMFPHLWLAGLLLLATLSASPPARAVTLQQVLSRENTACSLTTNEMNVGLDGNVYLTNGSGGSSYIMRISTTGANKNSAVVGVEASSAVAANANGVIATANGHFARSVNLYSASFASIASVGGFLGNDQVGWDAPSDVEVGTSGNFYGLDQHNYRIYCINPQGQIIATYNFPAQAGEVSAFRVSEAAQRFILYVNYGTLTSVDFSGNQKWTGTYNPSGYDVDASGNLYILQGYGNTVTEYNVNGTQIGTYTLTGAPTNQSTSLLRISNGQAIVRYCWNTELFRVYNLSTGALVNTVAPAIDTLTATYGSETWTAGAVTPFTIAFTSALSPAPTPAWHVWGRPCDSAVSLNGSTLSSTYQDFGYTTSNGGQITVPTGCAGLYDIKVTPEQAGWQRGAQSEYWVHDIVEIRTPSASGAISVYTTPGLALAGTVAVTNGSANVVGTGTHFTTALAVGNVLLVEGQEQTIASITDDTHLAVSNNYTLTGSGLPLYLCSANTYNRLHFNAGDQIPFLISVRANANWPSSVTVNLTDANNNVVAAGTAAGLPAANNSVAFFIPGAITAGLAPGSYTLKATNSGFTCVPQPIILGAGLQKPPFRFILYGDYGSNYPNGNLSQERDLVANNTVALKKTGVNMVVERLGWDLNVFPFRSWPSGQGTDGQDLINTVQSRLSADPTATDPAKAAPEVPVQQTQAAYSAGNTESMSILMAMDTSVPIGTSPNQDPRTAAQFQADTTTVTDFLLPYAAFRGWVWGNEWWTAGGADGSGNTDTTYTNDVNTAKSTGVWNSYIDTVAGTRLNRGANAWTTLASTPAIVNNPQLATATAGEFRNIDCWPPYNFSNVTESDLNAQWEQYKVPYDTTYGVDYYKRFASGKKGWLHPEIWNDTGTGEQILPSLFMGMLRQLEGVGCSTSAGGDNMFEGWQVAEDSRSAFNGTSSVYRALSNAILQPYGPWLTTLSKNDRVAIVVSARQSEIDDSPLQLPRYFGRLFEAYLALLHCHYPAALVFTTDMTSTSLNGYKAVFLVDQFVELDPGLQTALTNAHNAGATIFYDDDCKDVDSVFSTFGAVDLKTYNNSTALCFSQFEALPTEAGNDYTYISFLNAVRNDEPALTAALASITPPATIGIDEVFTAESVEEQGRYVYVANNITPTAIDPGDEWQVTNFCTTRVPIETTVTLPNVTGMTVYDVFAKTSLGTPSGGNVTADLRSLPMRIYAMLPKAIDHVQVTGPNTSVTCGQPFNWIVKVCDSTNTAIAASIPVHVQLLAADGVTVLREQYAGATSAGASGTFVLPANLVGGSPILKATELFTGMSSSQTIGYTTVAQQTLPLQGQTGPNLNTPVAATLATNGNTADPTVTIAQNAFGPHVRDLAISADGSQVLCATMNWDHNLYAVNVGTGAVNWRQRAGMYFTFCPQATTAGFAVQGYNFGTAEGYGMYLVSPTGALNMRFNSYGIARRDLGWLLSSPTEADPQNNFTAAPDGSWVATAGNLGLAVWNSSGTLLRKQDWPDRHVGRVLAISTTALLVCEGLKVTSYNATTGAQNWQKTLDTNPGIITKPVVSGDGSTVALLSTDQGGTVFVLNAGTGAVTATFPTGGQDLGITSTSALIAVASGNQLKLYSKTGGLQWIFNGDSYVRFPRFSGDNTKLVCTSDLGAVDVFDTSGNKLFERDMGALCAPAWVTSGSYTGDLILASWEGAVYHLTAGSYAQTWSLLLQPTATDMRNSLLNNDGAPVTKVTTWSNAQGTNYPITPNLLSPSTAYITYVDNGNQYAYFQPTNLGNPYGTEDASALVDGSATAPSTPWLHWEDVFRESVNGAQTDITHIQLDTWNTMMQVTGITLWEDPNNPQSWVRDATLDYWDVPSQTWKTGPALLSDAVTHSHAINPPIQSPRVRVTLPPTCTNNIRLGEIVLNGATLGCSHPDVVAGNNTCVLFDENTFPLNGRMVGSYNFQYSDAYSGAMCFATTAPGVIYPNWGWSGPFHYWIQDWNMKIAQTPQNANEYRYLQFAWKACDTSVTGITLEVGDITGGSASSLASLYCGAWCGMGMYPFPSTVQSQISATVPTSWQLVTVDLWALTQATGGLNIRSMNLCTTGGSGKVEFDAIKLFKTNPTGQAYTAPTASITAPANNAQFAAPASVGITTTASDTNSGGSITKVEFYNGDALLGSATSSPYTYTWTNVAAGSYALTARAYDNFGLEGNSSVVNITVNASQCAAPTFSPAAGSYTSAQSVTISSTTGGASIRYTTDGSAPTETNGTVYSIPVNISTSCTLKAIAYESGYTDSNVTAGAYAICNLPTSGLLLWLHADGITGLNNGQSVTTWNDASGNGYNAVYTNPNGEVAPLYETNAYNGLPCVRFSGDNLLQVSALPLGPYTIATVLKPASSAQMMVYEHSDNMLQNANANFLFTTTQSTVSVKRNNVQTGKDIVESNASTWAASPGVPLLTVDEFGGTDASEQLFINGSQQWLNENYVGNLNNTTAYTEPFNIGERASYGGYQLNGDIAEMVVYNHVLSTSDLNTLTSALMSKYALINAPTATLTAPTNGAQFNAPANITLSATASVSGGAISKVEFYNGTTLLGTITSSPYNYTWSNVAAGSYAITAIAYSNNNLTAPTATANITVNVQQCAAPTFNPTAGTYGSAQSVAISTTTGGATIRYTTDGSTPSETNGTVYSSAVNISVNTTLKAIAYETGYSDSTVTSGTYNIQCAAPTFSPAPGAYDSTQTVTISSTTGGTTISYTTDGSTPTESHGTMIANGGTATISSTATLKAIAYVSGMTDSNVTSGTYTINALPTTGMLLWLNAQAITGVSNGGNVTTWNDASGNNRNAAFTSPNGEVAPTYATNVYNGMPVVRFNGHNLLQVSALPLGTYTVAAVFKTTGNSQIVYEHSDNTLTNSNGNFLYTSTQSTICVKRGGAQTGKDLLGAGASTWAANCSTPILTVDEFGGTDASEVLYINGSLMSLVENWTGSLNTTTATTQHFNIGERAAYGGQQFNGDIAEIVVYDHALSTTDFNTLNTALKAKYALDTPPTVSITAPANNASYTAPASVTITASATANTGTISKVEFYDGAVLIGTATTSPYSITWSNAEKVGGSFPLTAKAYDSAGFATVSTAVNITVNDTNLKAYWKFDEDTGASATDSSGTGNTGTVANGTWLPGKINCCLGFNGASSSVQKTSASSLPAANGTQTVGFWMFVSATPSAKATALAVSGSSSGVFIGYNSSTTFGVWKNAGTLLVSTTTLPSVNAWHYITYVKNGSTNYLYIDGTQVNTSTTSTDSGSATTLTAGMTPGGTNYFNGDLDEIRVYTRALSAAEISGLAAGKQ